MLNGNEMKAFYRIFFPKRPGEGGLAARVPDVNETRLNDNFKTISDEFRKILEFIKNGFKTKSLTVDDDASIGGDASVGGQLSAGSAALGDTNVTGTLDVDGSATFDNGVTVGGALSVTNRRANMTSNIAAGWHRVLEFAPATASYRLGRAGIIIEFDITRYGTANETHHVSLSLVEGRVRFYGEESNSNGQYIDAIRYTHDSSRGYVDIHLSTTAVDNIAVDYQVAASANPFFSQINTESLVAVADSPSGETVLAEYTFATNTITDISSSFALNAGITGIDGKIHAIYDASSRLVHLNFSAYTASATFGTTTPIFTCSNSKYMPNATASGNGMIRLNSGEWYPYEISIGSNGNIVQSLTGTATRVYGQITYPV